MADDPRSENKRPNSVSRAASNAGCLCAFRNASDQRDQRRPRQRRRVQFATRGDAAPVENLKGQRSTCLAMHSEIVKCGRPVVNRPLGLIRFERVAFDSDGTQVVLLPATGNHDLSSASERL